MCLGKAVLEKNLKELRSKEDKLSNKEKDQISDMRIVQEMYARGFEFAPIDVYKAHSRHFQIIDGKLMPSLTSIEGMGEKAADGVMEAAKDGPFLSKDDFRSRTKVSQTICDKMTELGLLDGLPESNQISLFDFMQG